MICADCNVCVLCVDCRYVRLCGVSLNDRLKWSQLNCYNRTAAAVSAFRFGLFSENWKKRKFIFNWQWLTSSASLLLLLHHLSILRTACVPLMCMCKQTITKTKNIFRSAQHWRSHWNPRNNFISRFSFSLCWRTIECGCVCMSNTKREKCKQSNAIVVGHGHFRCIIWTREKSAQCQSRCCRCGWIANMTSWSTGEWRMHWKRYRHNSIFIILLCFHHNNESVVRVIWCVMEIVHEFHHDFGVSGTAQCTRSHRSYRHRRRKAVIWVSIGSAHSFRGLDEMMRFRVDYLTTSSLSSSVRQINHNIQINH